MDPATLWIGCLVISWFIVQYVRGGASQARTELDRARQNWAREIQQKMDQGWQAGPAGSPWFWAAAGWRAWRSMTRRRGDGATPLPASSPWRRVASAAWARGRLDARRLARQLRAQRDAAGGFLGAAAAFAALLAALAALTAGAGQRSRSRSRRGRGRGRGRGREFRICQCDECRLLFSENALELVPKVIGGRAGVWWLCPQCRGVQAPPPPPPEPEPEPLPPPVPDPELDHELDPALELELDPAHEAPAVPAGELGPSQADEDDQPAGHGETEGDDPAMTGQAVATAGEAMTHGQWNTAVADLHVRLGDMPGQVDMMLGGLTSVDAGREQIHGVIALGAACGAYLDLLRDMFRQVDALAMPVVETYAAAGGVDNAPKPAYFSEI